MREVAQKPNAAANAGFDKGLEVGIVLETCTGKRVGLNITDTP